MQGMSGKTTIVSRSWHVFEHARHVGEPTEGKLCFSERFSEKKANIEIQAVQSCTPPLANSSRSLFFVKFDIHFYLGQIG